VVGDVRNEGCSEVACWLKQIDTAFFEDDCDAMSLALPTALELVLQV